MGVFHGPRLVSLAVLMLASQLDFARGAVRVSAVYAVGLTGDPIGDKPDPYVKVWCGGQNAPLLTFAGMTKYVSDNANPRWAAEFNFPNCKANDKIKMEVWDRDLIYDDLLGRNYLVLQKGVSSASWSVSTGGAVLFTLEVK